jgi:hypothetical protein
MNYEKPVALSLADYLDLPHVGQHKSAAELRRQHDEIESLRAELTLLGSACDKIRMMHREEVRAMREEYSRVCQLAFTACDKVAELNRALDT